MARLVWFSRTLPVLFGCLLSASAFASPTYPPTIQSDLGLAQAPDCTLCHRDQLGGAGTVVRPFGRTLIDHFQLTGNNNVALLKAALAGDDAQNLDSDGDGVTDIDELRMGTNPNVGVSGVEAGPDVPLPETGCALAVRSPVSDLSVLLVMCVGLGFFARRSRRAR